MKKKKLKMAEVRRISSEFIKDVNNSIEKHIQKDRRLEEQAFHELFRLSLTKFIEQELKSWSKIDADGLFISLYGLFSTIGREITLNIFGDHFTQKEQDYLNDLYKQTILRFSGDEHVLEEFRNPKIKLKPSASCIVSEGRPSSFE